VDDEEGTVVLFPSPDAVEAGSLAAAPRQVIVLDGGWRECVRMNSWISQMPCIGCCREWCCADMPVVAEVKQVHSRGLAAEVRLLQHFP